MQCQEKSYSPKLQSEVERRRDLWLSHLCLVCYSTKECENLEVLAWTSTSSHCSPAPAHHRQAHGSDTGIRVLPPAQGNGLESSRVHLSTPLKAPERFG